MVSGLVGVVQSRQKGVITVTRSCVIPLCLLISMSIAVPKCSAQNSCYPQGHLPQTTRCLAHFTVWVGDLAPPYGAQCYCGDGVPRMYTDCWIRTDQCSAICPTCNLAAGSPINLSTGNTFISQTDIALPGLGGGLNLARTWNSIAQDGSGTVGMFGMNWISSYEDRMFVSSDGLVVYADGKGDAWSFGVTSIWGGTNGASTYSLVAPRNGGASLSYDGNYLTLTLKGGEKRIFNPTSGQLLSISDRNGNTAQLSYDASHRLITVTDAASRHLYFTYSQGSNLVASITSDFGVSLSYIYNGLYLTQVTNPDGTFVTFEYSLVPPGMIYVLTAVRDQSGKILESHTYDVAGRGLSSQRANRADALSVTYLQ